MLTSRLRKCLLLVAVNLGVLAALAGLGEALFRFQVVDTYGQELRAKNRTLPNYSESADVLVLGDSFSLGINAYATQLSAQFSTRGWTVVNSAVSGFTVRDALRISSKRIQRFRPKLAVYQIYLGNDLLETRAPFNTAESLPRWFFWRATHGGWRSLAWLNYRLRGFSLASIAARRGPPPEDHEFDPATYQSRERRWIATFPSYLKSQHQLSDQAAWSSYQRDLHQLIGQLSETANTVVLLMVPHCTEVAAIYRQRFESLGLPADSQPPLGGGGAWREALAAIAHKNPNVLFVDALAALATEEAKGQATYFDNDPHLNSHGHKVLADLLAPELSRRLEGIEP